MARNISIRQLRHEQQEDLLLEKARWRGTRSARGAEGRGGAPEAAGSGAPQATRSGTPQVTAFGKVPHDPGTPREFQYRSESERIAAIPEEHRIELYLHNIHDADGKHVGYQWHTQLAPTVSKHAGFTISQVMRGADPTRQTGRLVRRVEDVRNLSQYGLRRPTWMAEGGKATAAPYVVPNSAAHRMYYGTGKRGDHCLLEGDAWQREYTVGDNDSYRRTQLKEHAAPREEPYNPNSRDMVHVGGHTWSHELVPHTLPCDTAEIHDVDHDDFFGHVGDNLKHSLKVYGTPDAQPGTLGFWRGVSEARTFAGYKPGGSVPIPAGLASREGHAKMQKDLEEAKGKDNSLLPDGNHPRPTFTPGRVG